MNQVIQRHSESAGSRTSRFRAASGANLRLGAGLDRTVKSATRVLEILELFSFHRRALSVGEISDELAYPQSSTSMLLQSLHRLGYLCVDPASRLYAPSVRVSVLGGWPQDRLTPGISIVRVMEEIRERTGETVVLGQQRGSLVQYVEVLTGMGDPAPLVRNGTCLAIARDALGRVLLSTKSDAEVRQLLRTMNASLEDPEERVGEDALLAQLRDIRQSGYGCCQGTVPASHVLAIELPTARHSPALAIGVQGEMARLSARTNDILKVLRDVAGRVRIA